ncbi:Uncharacterised protein [Serratia quinivorans]|uniref:hypothetical protein n=1 Tax=Serratia quinivorans TaxID=137545 RepID=UPI00217B9B75|nr:hypothetical protein [Serratia quinivorans]CAI0837331.1 Uncharacterised protein [Serratia quinivorans]
MQSLRYQAPIISLLYMSVQVLSMHAAAASQIDNMGPPQQLNQKVEATSRFKTDGEILLKSRSYIEESSYSNQGDMILAKSASQFYSDLNSKQETLGKDFEGILVDNVWDLYLD